MTVKGGLRKLLERASAFALALGISLLPAAAYSQYQASEYDLKAAFLVQFTSYVTWPDGRRNDPSVPLRFGIVGAPELADNLTAMVGTPALAGRAIEVRRLNEDDNPSGLHVLFVAGEGGPSAELLLDRALDQAVLTVTEQPEPTSPVSVINFEVLDGKVRFEVSLAAAQQGALSISARLLQVAARVTGEP